MTKLKVGPLLGLDSQDLYTVCFLTDKSASSAGVVMDGAEHPAVEIDDTPDGRFWRAEVSVPITNDSRYLSYNINVDQKPARDTHDRSTWTFYVPAEDEPPRIAYASCNGFSDGALAAKTDKPYLLWKRMCGRHGLVIDNGEDGDKEKELDEKSPFSLLIMGGDQLYADEIWSKVGKLSEWRELNKEVRIDRSATKTMRGQIDRFYSNLYCERWSDPHMSLMLSSVPSVMMWDDHDIFDGWGSYPDEIQECEVYQGIFQSARRYFELFQIRSKRNASLLDPDAGHYAFSVRFRKYRILALDNRAERTRSRVMSDGQWSKLTEHLTSIENEQSDLLVLSAVPVIYRDFSLTETVFDTTPWEEELTDDLKDHWRAKDHQGERTRLIMNLLKNTRERARRTVILSGDVHIGTLGVVNDMTRSETVKIHQVVSSGIVHPSPSRIQWLGIMAITNDNDEYLNEEKTIETRILHPFGSDKYIRRRNFVTLKEGTDDKLWVTWESDTGDKPEYPLN